MTDRHEGEPHRSWWALLQALRDRLHELTALSPLDWSLTRFVLLRRGEAAPQVVESAPFDCNGFLATYTPTPTNTATLGFLISGGLNGKAVGAKFVEGLERCRRQRRPSQGPSVHTDSKLLLGLSAGVAAIRVAEEQKSWLHKQLESLASGGDLTKRLLGGYAGVLIGSTSAWDRVEQELLRAQPTEPFEVVVVLWLLSLDPSRFSDLNRSALERLRKQILPGLALLDIGKLDALGAALATDLVARLLQNSVTDLEQTAVGRLVALLERLPVAWAREAQPPRDEYDIQRVLWTMLTGVYPDVRDEQWLRQFGVYQPRADLAVESLKTVVEAKFIKRPGDFRKIQDELISDTVSYTSRPERFDKLIAVVYDATASQHKHGQLREMLEKQPGIARVLLFPQFVPRPTKRGRKPRRAVRVGV